MKRITVTLTEDQARDLISLIEGWLPSAEWAVENKRADDKTKAKIAFRKRLLTTLHLQVELPAKLPQDHKRTDVIEWEI